VYVCARDIVHTEITEILQFASNDCLFCVHVCIDLVSQIMARCSSFFFFGVRRPEVSVFSHTNVRSSSLMLCLLC